MVVKGSDPTNLVHDKLTNIQLEYEVIHSVSLTEEAESTYINGKRFMYMYSHVSHYKMISVKKDTESDIRWESWGNHYAVHTKATYFFNRK